MKTINIGDKNSLQNAAKILKQGGILVFSTDTVYGIGCLLFDESIRKLYKIKNRPLSQPTSVLITQKLYHSKCSSTYSSMDIPEEMRKEFFEGKITIVFSTSMFKLKFPEIIIKDDKIGIRLPQSIWLEKLIDMVGLIVASSANKKGEPAPARFEDINQDIIEQADLTIKTDGKLPGIPSEVYDLELKKYLR